MWLMYTTVIGYMVILLFVGLFIMHFLKKGMVAEDSNIIDPKPEHDHNFDL
ncbi:hypothetical protein [Edaphobacillus lindanitolerans]|uniref:Uncharacterized protein n=1 Tax=Edaphobacillus lindanitolerans TaxID=550447 RepID=A0A1U7PTW3_9BACI|nr:hypothetical protein [Edaphobacillus lindanitolerans]SIT93126.1 hypothetical protein SAMN05428946_2954 [Edaphobacillus lindanitolerans]